MPPDTTTGPPPPGPDEALASLERGLDVLLEKPIASSTSEAAHTGSWKAWLDGYGTTHTDSLAQGYWQATLGDHIVQDLGKRVLAHAVLDKDERRGRVRDILIRNIDRHFALVGSFEAGIDLALLRFHNEFMQRALFGCAVIGFTNGALSSFIVIRRLALMADAMAHSLLPGVAVALLLFGLMPGTLFVGALVAALLVAFGTQIISNSSRIKEDTSLVRFLSGWF